MLRTAETGECRRGVSALPLLAPPSCARAHGSCERPEELRQTDLESGQDGRERVQRDPRVPALQAPDVRPVDPGQLAQFLLGGDPGLEAEVLQPLPDLAAE